MIIRALITDVITMALWLFVLAVILSLLGLKWRLFRHLRDGYLAFLKVVAGAVVAFLWRPAFERDGIGNYVDEDSVGIGAPPMTRLSLRDRRTLITFLYHASVIGIAVIFIIAGDMSGNDILIDMGAFIVLAHVLLFRRLPAIHVLQRRFITSHYCSCGYHMPMHGRWRCKCQAVTIRHALSKCPREGCGGFDSLNCPRCQVTHIL